MKLRINHHQQKNQIPINMHSFDFFNFGMDSFGKCICCPVIKIIEYMIFPSPQHIPPTEYFAII